MGATSINMFSRTSVVVVIAVMLASTCSSDDASRLYSSEELAVEEIVEDHLNHELPFALYRTIDEWMKASSERSQPLVGTGHERERNFFESQVRIVLSAAGETLPPDVARGSGVLHDAEYEAMDECAADAGWPGVQLYDVSQQLGEEYEREFGLTLNQFLDLRHECAKHAATYPTLDPVYRDELLARRRAHYMGSSRMRSEWGRQGSAAEREGSPRIGAVKAAESGGSLWSTTLRACASCWWDWATWRSSASTTTRVSRWGCMCAVGRRDRPVGTAAGRCGPTVSGRWCWWTSPRSAGRCAWCGTSAGGAAHAMAVRRAQSPSRRRRSRRCGRF